MGELAQTGGLVVLAVGLVGGPLVVACGPRPLNRDKVADRPASSRDSAGPSPGASGAPGAPGPSGATAEPGGPLASVAGVITPKLLEAHVRTLASDALKGRPTPSPELDRAAEYIVGVFSALELRAIPAAPEFKQSFRCGRVEGVHSANVIATLPGADPALADEAVLVTAHYDHIGTKHDATGEDHIYNGANDNAAGTAAMLGVAAALTALPQPPRRSVVFIAFCGEELGLLGSKYYVEHPLFELPKTIAVVNLEMLGRPLPESPPVAWVTGAELSDLIESFPRPDEGSGVKFVPSSTIGWQEAAAFGRSDNAAFADQDVVAHTISTGKIDAYYHSVDDEPEVLDFERMALIVRALTLGVHRLADAPTRPAWTEIGQAAGYGD